MTDFSVETVVIGAGVVGLAISRELSNINGEILVLESEKDFGQLTSSRNSGVIHAGIYYPENSLKSKFCIEGNILLYEYCKKYNIPTANFGIFENIEDAIKFLKSSNFPIVVKVDGLASGKGVYILSLIHI